MRQAPAPKLKLEYFGQLGRPEPIRALLQRAQVDFEEVTVDQKDWWPRKSAGKAGEFSSLPIVTVDGQE